MESNDKIVAPLDRAIHGLRWIGSARAVTQLTTWGLTAVTVRFLRPEDYGLVATSGLFTTFAALLLDGGLTEVLVSRHELPEEQQGAAATAVLLISAVLASAVFVLAPIGSSYFHSPLLKRVLQVCAFYLPLAALTVVPLALQSRGMHFRRIAVIQTLSSLLQGIATLVMAYLGEGYWALILGTFLGTGIRASLAWATLGRWLIPNLRLNSLQPLMRSSGHMLSQRLTYFATTNFDTFLLSRFAGLVALGPYTLGKALSHTALDQIAGIVNEISVPTFAAQRNASSQLRGLIKIVSLASTILFPLFWLMGTLSQVALPLVFGSRWAAVVVPFAAFCFILPLRGIYTLLDASVVGTGRISTTLKNMLLWAALMIPLLLVGVSMKVLGTAVYGAALAWLVSIPIVFFAAIRRIAKVFDARARDVLQPMWVPMLCALTSSAAVEVVQVTLSSRLNTVLLFGCEALVGGASYLLTIREFGRVHYDQFLEILSRLIPPARRWLESRNAQ